MLEYIIAVDKDDREIRPIEKLETHEKGILHRAFSIFIVNSKKRAEAAEKGQWEIPFCSRALVQYLL